MKNGDRGSRFEMALEVDPADDVSLEHDEHVLGARRAALGRERLRPWCAIHFGTLAGVERAPSCSVQ